MDQKLPPHPPLWQLMIFLSAASLLYGLLAGLAAAAWGMIAFMVAAGIGYWLKSVMASIAENHPDCRTSFERLSAIFSLQMLSAMMVGGQGWALLTEPLWMNTFIGLVVLGFGLSAYEVYQHRTHESPSNASSQA